MLTVYLLCPSSQMRLQTQANQASVFLCFLPSLSLLADKVKDFHAQT